MTIYLVAHAIGAAFAIAGLWAISAQERRSSTARPIVRDHPQLAPQGEIQPHRGDYSAWQASSIEGKCNHV